MSFVLIFDLLNSENKYPPTNAPYIVLFKGREVIAQDPETQPTYFQ